MNANVIKAIFKRNFLAYFTSPIGYVFICLFVFACAVAAFFPPAFFNARLATLDQLNEWFPLILLLFVPAVTMGIWADEQRQGTDELLLTIPASDFAVVVGKYLSIASIYIISLALAMASNFIMLLWMGTPDWGLIFTNFVGYTLLGMVMLATGMCASFITGNLTMAYVFGFVFNLPIVLFSHIDDIFGDSAFAQSLSAWTVGDQLDELNRGILSLTSLVYFTMLTVAWLYLCMVLIGRRHWLGGRDGSAMIGHYAARALALIVVAGALMVTFKSINIGRFDLTINHSNSLSADTKKILQGMTEAPLEQLEEQRADLEQKEKELKAKQDDQKVADELKSIASKLRKNKLEQQRLENPILIEAYISKQVPEAYVRSRRRLVTALAEFDAIGGNKITTKLYHVEKYSAFADQARDKHGIEPRQVMFQVGGVAAPREIFMAAAVTSGDKTRVIPFFELGIPVEYELLVAISDISQVKKKRLGIVKTDAPMMAGGNMMMGSMRREQRLVTELRKQFEVEEVDPRQRINDPAGDRDDDFDVLLVVQPSTLGLMEMSNLIDAIRRGVPTALFEDPFPFFPEFRRTTAGTGQEQRIAPRPPGMAGMFQRSTPAGRKGDISALWRMLGVEPVQSYFEVGEKEDGSPDYASSIAIIWQRFSPYAQLRKYQEITNQWVFLRDSAPGADESFDDDEITSGLFELLFVAPGAIRKQRFATSPLQFTPLVRTGSAVGVISHENYSETLPDQFGIRESDPYLTRVYEQTQKNEYGDDVDKVPSYVLAARIHGELPAPSPFLPLDGKPDKKANDEEPKATSVDVVLVADIDMLDSLFIGIRSNPQAGVQFEFQNVPFVLNILDSLAGDDRFLAIRKERSRYGDLTAVREEEARLNRRIDKTIDEEAEQYRDKLKNAEKKMKDAIKDVEKALKQAREKGDFANASLALQSLGLVRDEEQKKLEAMKKQQKVKRDKAIDENEDERERTISVMESRYKILAILLPPIPPLFLAIVVYFTRRSRESEGVAASRLR